MDDTEDACKRPPYYPSTPPCVPEPMHRDRQLRLSTRMRKGWMVTVSQTPACVKGSARLKVTTSSLDAASKMNRESIIVSRLSASKGPETTVATLPDAK